MRLLIVCPYPSKEAPSQRFRFEQYLGGLDIPYRQVGFWRDSDWPKIYQPGNLGFKVSRTLLAFMRRFFLLLSVWRYDRVFVHREATPIGPPWFEWWVVKVFRKPLVYDFDDAVWLPNASEANAKILGKVKSHGKVGKICRWAEVVMVGNSFLGEYARGERVKSALRYNQSLPGLITQDDKECQLVEEGVNSEKLKGKSALRYNQSLPGLITQDDRNDEKVIVIPTTIDTEGLHNPALYELQSIKNEEKVKSFDTNSRRGEFTQDDKNDERDKVIVVPTTIDTEGLHNPVLCEKEVKGALRYNQSLPGLITQGDTEKKLLTIGWTGTHSTLKQLVPLFPLLEEVYKAHPFRFLLIADTAPEDIPRFVEFCKWNKETEIADLMRMDIGIMPLYDTDWERGKCGFKALQYMALGIPAVVSDVGVNPEIVVDDVTGCVCEAVPTDGVKWKWDLLRLLGDDSLRESLGVKGRERVVERYSVEAWREVYTSVLGKN